MSYYLTPKNPLSEALEGITGLRPPGWVNGVYHSKELGDRVVELQDWCSSNARPFWSTGLGILEAAEQIVKVAIENGNIDCKQKRGDDEL